MVRKNSSGFTLVELIVVLGIIGILSAAIIFAINPVLQIQKGRDTTRKADLNNIRTSLEIFRQAEGQYPEEVVMGTCGGALTTSGGLTVMQELPCDPQTDAPYLYSTVGSGPRVVYTISACLENENDSDIEPPDSQISGCDTTYTQQNP